jgi:hypothetical protein
MRSPLLSLPVFLLCAASLSGCGDAVDDRDIAPSVSSEENAADGFTIAPVAADEPDSEDEQGEDIHEISAPPPPGSVHLGERVAG